MRMKNPPHPGRIVRQECIEPLGLTVTEAAKRLGVRRQTLNNLVNGKGGVSAEMARLELQHPRYAGLPDQWRARRAGLELAGIGTQDQGSACQLT